MKTILTIILTASLSLLVSQQRELIKQVVTPESMGLDVQQHGDSLYIHISPALHVQQWVAVLYYNSRPGAKVTGSRPVSAYFLLEQAVVPVPKQMQPGYHKLSFQLVMMGHLLVADTTIYINN